MKIAQIVARVLIYVVGVMFIIMSLDCFSTVDGSFWYKIGCFLINSLPGIIILALVYFLRKQNHILGITIIAASLIFFFVTKMYLDINEKILTIVIFFVPLLASGIIILLYNDK